MFSDRFGSGWNRFWMAPSDPFTLSVVRVLTGLMTLYWYLTFMPDLDHFFGPNGLLPSSLIAGGGENNPGWRGGQGFSVLDYAHTTQALWAIYGAGLVILVLFTLGVATRVMSIAALITVWSFIERGPMLATALDDMLAMLLLYLCIGPCGAALSVDAWLRKRRAKTPADTDPRLSTSATVSLRLIQVHLTAIYLLMALAKIKYEVWWTGEAVWIIGVRPESRLFNWDWLHDKLYLINIWTLIIPVFELTFAIFVWNRLARPLLLALAVFMWLTTGLLTGLLAFSLMMLAANVAFISSDALRGWLHADRWRSKKAVAV